MCNADEQQIEYGVYLKGISCPVSGQVRGQMRNRMIELAESQGRRRMSAARETGNKQGEGTVFDGILERELVVYAEVDIVIADGEVADEWIEPVQHGKRQQHHRNTDENAGEQSIRDWRSFLQNAADYGAILLDFQSASASVPT